MVGDFFNMKMNIQMKQKAIVNQIDKKIHRKNSLYVSNNKWGNEMEKFDSQKQVNVYKAPTTIPSR